MAALLNLLAAPNIKTARGGGDGMGGGGGVTGGRCFLSFRRSRQAARAEVTIPPTTLPPRLPIMMPKGPPAGTAAAAIAPLLVKDAAPPLPAATAAIVEALPVSKLERAPAILHAAKKATTPIGGQRKKKC